MEDEDNILEEIKEIYKDKFYKEYKVYQKKKLMSEREKELFNKLKTILGETNLKVLPQISLRSIINTPYDKTTSEELYKFIDYVIFDKDFNPLIAIELNSRYHEENPYTIVRDASNEKILSEVDIPLIEIWYDENQSIKHLRNILKTELKKQGVFKVTRIITRLSYYQTKQSQKKQKSLLQFKT